MYCLLISCALAADPAPADPVDRARGFVAVLARGDFDGAVKQFDDNLAKVLPADRLKTIWEAVTRQFGPFEKATDTRTEPRGKLTAVYVTCQFGKGPLDVRVVLNAEQKLSGLQFVPAPPKEEYRWPDYVKPDSFRESEAAVGAGTEWELPATLTVPTGPGPFPAAVLVHASGPHDRDETMPGTVNKPFKDLAGGLASRGIAVLRYEKRTRQHGAKMMAGPVTIKEEVLDDALAAVNLLRTTPGIDPKRVVVVGHSLGATLAPRLAERDGQLGGIVLLAGAARPIEDLILEQMTYVIGLTNDPEAVKLDKLKTIKEQVAKVKDPQLAPDTPAEQLPFGQPAAYWLSLRGYEPAKLAAGVKTPVLLLHGDRDYQVTLDDFAVWEKELAAKPHATLKRFATLNHLFMDGEGKATPAEYQKTGHVAAAVVEEIAAWMVKK